jgi:sensor c-di-GMP phosphodiesterase-like protein
MKKVLNIFLIVVIVLAVVYFAGEQGWLSNTPLKNFDHHQLNIFSQQASDQTKILTSRAKETSSHLQNILGDKVEVDEQEANKPLHEKTIEYAHYLYCKQVVEEYERQP